MIKTLIEAIYEDNEKLPADFSFYEQVTKENDFTEIAPQIYILLKEKALLELTPEFFQAILKKTFNQCLFQNIFIKNQMAIIFEAFEAKSIEAIPLKGVMFAERYFSHTGGRPTSDIDLLIRLEDKKCAMECVRRLGFTEETKEIPSHFHCSLSKALPDSSVPLTVELHWGVLKENTAEFDINELWNDAVPFMSYNYIKMLSNYYSFYLICLHGWRHNLQSQKYFLDIIQMIALLEKELDYGTLLKNAKAHRTVKRMVRTLSIVYQQYPFLDKIIELPNKRKNLYWEDSSLNTKKGMLRYIDYIDYQFLSYDTVRHSFNELADWTKNDMVMLLKNFRPFYR